MSLINDALKKAQREREGGNAPTKQNIPSVGGARPHRGNPADKTSFKVVRVLVVGGITLGALFGAVGFLVFLLNKPPPPAVEVPEEVAVTIKHADSTTPSEPAAPSASTQRTADRLEAIPAQSSSIENPVVVPAPTVAVSPPASEPTTATAAPVPAPIPAPTPTVVAKPAPAPTPVAPAPAPSPQATSVAPVAAAPVQSKPVPAPAPTPVAPSPPSAPAVVPATPVVVNLDSTPPAQPALPQMPEQPVSTSSEPAASTPVSDVSANAEPNPKIVAFLEASRITGIKVAGSKSRVLMNNQVFKVGSIVEAQSQLKITSIQKNEIQFVDESGVEYRQQFQR